MIGLVVRDEYQVGFRQSLEVGIAGGIDIDNVVVLFHLEGRVMQQGHGDRSGVGAEVFAAAVTGKNKNSTNNEECGKSHLISIILTRLSGARKQ